MDTSELLVHAIVAGDIMAVSQLLEADPSLAVSTVPGNPRTMLHYATDWPGHRPNVEETIGLLVRAGADPGAAMPIGDDLAVAETPLHWAASADDVVAINALLTAGADVDAAGGLFGGCTPYQEAVIFQKYEAARRLLAAGATNHLPGAAALGDHDLIAGFFDDDGEVRLDRAVLPHWNSVPARQSILDCAFHFACRAGHLEIARDLFERGANPSSVTAASTSALEEADSNGHADVADWLRSLEVRDEGFGN